MRIYTRSGDGGETALAGGDRVPKDHLRVEACGEVDEANAAIGAARACDPTDFADDLLAAIQRDLFAIGGRLATPDPERLRAPQRARVAVGPERVADLEHAIDAATAQLPPLAKFILPGGTPKATALHLARAVSRRAERAVVHLGRVETVPPEVLAYLNRLSDLLFVLARLANHRAGTPDVTW